MAEPSSLIDPKLLEKVNLLFDEGKKGRLEQRGAISTAFQRGGRRGTSAFNKTFQKQLGVEQNQFRSLIGDALTNQINIDEAETTRKFTKDQAALDRDLTREIESDRNDAARDVAETEAIAARDAGNAAAIGIIIKGLTGGLF